ncbi:MAG: hypothetical protein AMJ62_03470 [Myxococcales bacterium SG8_38]|nr:MAG: hypothetical protein AMJ62_03470 [Myxococcales bacterium SG8_38]
MHALPSAITVCRVLLGLDRAGANGTLYVQGEGRSATLSLETGRIVAANVDRRVATSTEQVFDRVRQLCEWDGLVLELAQGVTAASWWKLAEPLPARWLALDTMRAAVRLADLRSAQADLAAALYQLTPTGERLLHGACLRPEEAALLPWLRCGIRAADIQALPGCGPSGYRFLWLLKLLRAAAPKAGGSSYPLLLRKRRQMRRHASPHALLDLPEGANGREARLALRKLVRDLHPDRYGDGAPIELRRASGEIVTALVEAEATIATRTRK